MNKILSLIPLLIAATTNAQDMGEDRVDDPFARDTYHIDTLDALYIPDQVSPEWIVDNNLRDYGRPGLGQGGLLPPPQGD